MLNMFSSWVYLEYMPLEVKQSIILVDIKIDMSLGNYGNLNWLWNIQFRTIDLPAPMIWFSNLLAFYLPDEAD